METVKALKASQQDLFVAQALLRPTFKNLIDAESFRAMKFVIFQISVVNYFGQAKHGSFTNPEEVDQRFETAAVAIVTEFRLYHDVRQCALMLRRCPGKDEFGFWIDEFVNQLGRTDTIDLRAGPGNPGFTLIFLGSQPSFFLRLSSIGFERFCRPEESLEILAT
jgi:hypothetical protein